ncbi:unnamed protein product [Miscanthus lutarioriparius]|uniref:Uncharacterized protein n=1 Tax=Miscanthus lutarioriparius TaxID=422564 RepID=A0A811PY48_9POAL|nr:unnamed protein product [Miscanthus lutarioriparius]
MKRTAQHDAGDDDDNRSARNPSVRVSSGLVAMNQAAAPHNDNDRRRIPRVIRNAVDGAWERPPHHAGYSPAVPVQMAGAHRWARYDDVVAALRSLANSSLLEQEAREHARATIRGLYQHPAPFDTDVRFPEAELFLSVDHGTFGQCMNRILKALLQVEAATKGYLSQRTVTACESFMEAVNYAAGTATLVWPEEPWKPVLYDRAVFEEAFQLAWTDA